MMNNKRLNKAIKKQHAKNTIKKLNIEREMMLNTVVY